MRIFLSLVFAGAIGLFCLPVFLQAEEEPLMVAVSTSPHHFAPGSETPSKKTTTITISSNKEADAVLVIKNGNGDVVRTISLSHEEGLTYIWDGRDEHGVVVADGTYATDVTATAGVESVTADSAVVVVDTLAPVVTLIGDNPLHVTFGSPWKDPGATINEGTLQVNSSISTNRLEPGTVLYKAIDQAGNVTEITRTVLIDAATVTFALSNLTHTYDGYPKSVVVHAVPNIPYTILYEGKEGLPVAEGKYAVTVVSNEIGYIGSAQATLTITSPHTTNTITTETEKYLIVPAEGETDIINKAVAEVRGSTLNIENLQRALIRTGHLAIAAPTGIFGPLTQTAVRFYQLAHDMPDTGFVDLPTIQALEQELHIDETALRTELENILHDVAALVSKVNGT